MPFVNSYANGDYELDAAGVPVKKAGGGNIGPQEQKKIQKAMENQRKRHEEYLKKHAADPKYFDERVAEVAKLQAEIDALKKA